MRLIAITALAGSLLCSTAMAATYTTIDNPADPTFNQLLGINNSGVISGYYGSSSVGHPNKGYTISAPYTNWASDNYPTSMQTQATGINDHGATTGFWSPTNLGGGDANYGFIRWNSRIKTPKGKEDVTYISVNDPHANSEPPVIQVLGINNNSIAAGFYNDDDGNSHGFVYDVETARYTPVNIPHATSVAATGINNNNLVCGFFVDESGSTIGFLKPIKSGTPSEFEVPKSKFTQFLGCNASGKAVGFFTRKDGIPHGVVYDPTDGDWEQVDAPEGEQGTVLNGINDEGEMVGFYMDNVGNTHGLLVEGE